MTIDLWCLVFCALLPLLLTVPVALGRARATDPKAKLYGFSNRETVLVGVPAWAKRAERAHANQLENLASFAVVVLVAHVTGKQNDVTALGSLVFAGARLLHPIVYMIGIVYVRTLVFAVGTVGLLMVLSQLF